MPPLRLPDEPDRPPLRLPRLRRPPTDRLNRGLSRSGDPEEACERRQALCRVVRHEPSSAIDCERNGRRAVTLTLTKNLLRFEELHRNNWPPWARTHRSPALTLYTVGTQPSHSHPPPPTPSHHPPPSVPSPGGTLSPHGATVVKSMILYGQLAQLSTAESGKVPDESQWCAVENMHTQ